MKFLAKFDFVASGLIGIYAGLIPACYSLVKIVSGDANEFVFLYAGWCMLAAPTVTFMLFNKLAKGMKNESNGGCQ